MLLDQLLHQIPSARYDETALRDARGRVIRAITPDARQVRPGVVYVALPKRQRENPFDIHAASDRGAEAVICEADAPRSPRVARIEVADCGAAFAQAAAAFHGHPARALQLLAVSGESPVRTVAAILLQRLLRAAGRSPALLTGRGCEAGGRVLPTPAGALDAFEIHRLLADHRRAGGDLAVVEATPEVACERGLELAAAAVRVSTSEPQAGWPLAVLSRSALGTRLQVDAGAGPVRVTTRLVGSRQIRALAVALRTAASAGVPVRTLLAAVPTLAPVTGCLEAVRCGQPFGVLVDGARTPEDLAATLREARETLRAGSGGRLILVCGARAEQSPAERAALGAAALGFAEQVVVTADNPGEVPFRELVKDFLGPSPEAACRVEPDRHAAIVAAVRSAGAGDVVVITGKGDCARQEIGRTVVPFDDARHAEAALVARGYVGR